MVYRLDGERLVSVRAGGGRGPAGGCSPTTAGSSTWRGCCDPTRPRRWPRPRLGRSELVEYAPERSLTVRALDRSGTVVGYAKRYAPGSVDSARSRRRYAAVAGHLHVAPGVSSPRPLARADDLVVLEPMTGTVLAELRVDADRAAAVGAAIAWVHGATPPSATPTFPGPAPARLAGAAAAVERAVPAPPLLTRRLLDALRRRPPTAGRVRPAAHGDCHPKNALVDGERVSLVDLDQAGLGSAAADLGSLLARGHVATLVRPSFAGRGRRRGRCLRRRLPVRADAAPRRRHPVARRRRSAR